MARVRLPLLFAAIWIGCWATCGCALLPRGAAGPTGALARDIATSGVIPKDTDFEVKGKEGSYLVLVYGVRSKEERAEIHRELARFSHRADVRRLAILFLARRAPEGGP